MPEHQHEYTSKPATQEYRDGWDRIFGKPEEPKPEQVKEQAQ